MCKCDKESGLLPQAKFEMAGFRNREAERPNCYKTKAFKIVPMAQSL